MWRKTLALSVAAVALTTLALQPPPPGDPELEAAIQQVQQGDFEAAIPGLDGAVRRLAAAGGKPKLLSRAYLYLSIAYLGLSQQQKAKAQFLEAWKADQGMELSPKEFPPKVLQFFEEARTEAAARTAPSPAPPPRGVASPQPGPEPPAPVTDKRGALPSPTATSRKGRSKTVPVLIGVGAVAVIGVAVAGGGGGQPAATVPPITQPTVTLDMLSASVTSPQRNTNLNCTDDVQATVTLTNRGSTAVAVSGVRRDDRIVFGDCSPAEPETFPSAVRSVGPNETATVLNRNLFSGGSGCCIGGGSCSGFCQIAARLTVVTGVGEVNAGEFGYGVRFDGCPPCGSSVAASGKSCSKRVGAP